MKHRVFDFLTGLGLAGTDRKQQKILRVIVGAAAHYAVAIYVLQKVILLRNENMEMRRAQI